MNAREVTEHLLGHSRLRYSRASGPGGQHRDHAETRAELIITRESLAGLPPQVAERLSERLGLARRPLRIASQHDRSRERNRARVHDVLLARVEAALQPRAPRRPTRPSQGAVARRLDQKARRSRTKAMRRGAAED